MCGPQRRLDGPAFMQEAFCLSSLFLLIALAVPRELKGRIAGATTVTVTKNEILKALNKIDDFILAVATLEGDAAVPRYIQRPFQREPDFGAMSVNYHLPEPLDRAEDPR